jgi:histidinol-phosphatase
MTAHADDLRLALRLADGADAITMARFRAADLVVETKPDLTPVSDADRAVEREVRASISRARPADAVVGEEYGADAATGNRRWIVDPIDGTKNYVRGVPVWGTLIALEVDGAMAVGVVSAPALGRRWWAARGGGAWAGQPAADPAAARPCRVSAVRRLADAFVSYSSLDWPDGGRRLAAVLTSVWRTRAFGDFWSHVLVAEGAIDAAFEPAVALWDVAPLQVIVEEAGGRFSDLTGRATPAGGSVVCSNGLLHDEVVTALTG